MIPDRIGALVAGAETDPFAFRGIHAMPDGSVVVRAFHPGARTMEVLDTAGGVVAPLTRVHPAGVFAGIVGKERFTYRLRARDGAGIHVYDDPYRFGPILGELDAWLLAKGDHLELYRVLGAHLDEREGIAGTRFAVWAPNARRVSVVGDWNGWDGRVHPMRLRRECGVWELFLPGVAAGARYKYELIGPHGQLLPLKTDPVAAQYEMRPANASIVTAPSTHTWSDDAWMAQRAQTRDGRAMALYEVHAGSWRRTDGNGFLSYRELADTLVPYAKELGFTHLELLPLTEHPFDGSWGYQSTGWFAPTSRFGDPDGLRAFIDAAHAAGLGVIMDWVPGHFPTDAWSLGEFDGTHLYEHADPRVGMHFEWGTYVFNLGRAEVANFLLASALYWLREFHVDGLRVDAVSSLIYLDYSRKPGEWIPNVYGGNENLAATAFLRRLTDTVRGRDGAITIAEESTAWPGVTAPTGVGGLGFDYKWNMGWMHDTLRFFGRDPLWRGGHLDDISFGLVYAFSERYVLPLSHDEVVHGKRSIIGRMPGATLEERFGDLRALIGEMYAHPGAKMLFGGTEFGQHDEWNDAHSLDWHLTDWEIHRGTMRLVADVNRLYRELPELHERDASPDGFEWIQYDDRQNAVVAWVRWSADRSRHLVAVLNASGMRLDGYRIGVPAMGRYAERLNTDAQVYGGANEGNLGGVDTDAVPVHGRPQSLVLTLPARSVLWLSQ